MLLISVQVSLAVFKFTYINQVLGLIFTKKKSLATFPFSVKRGHSATAWSDWSCIG
jgi:hypothetical protein